MGVPAVLLEGREPTRFDDDSYEQRTVEALVASLSHVTASARQFAELSVARRNQRISNVPIRSRYRDADRPREMDFFDPLHEGVRRVVLEGAYSTDLKVTRTVLSPGTYAVSREREELIQLLQRHGISSEKWKDEPDCKLQQYRIRHVEHSLHPRRPPRRLRTEVIPFTGSQRDYLWIPVTEDNARLLAVLLDPHSKYGVTRYRQLGLYPKIASDYPVLAVRYARGEHARKGGSSALSEMSV